MNCSNRPWDAVKLYCDHSRVVLQDYSYLRTSNSHFSGCYVSFRDLEVYRLVGSSLQSEFGFIAREEFFERYMNVGNDLLIPSITVK